MVDEMRKAIINNNEVRQFLNTVVSIFCPTPTVSVINFTTFIRYAFTCIGDMY